MALDLSELHPGIYNAIKLGGFALVTALLLGTTYVGTREQIELAQRQLEQRALSQVVQGFEHAELDLQDRLPVPSNALSQLRVPANTEIQIVRDSAGQALAWIVPSVATDGYSGAIRMIVGIDSAGLITGIRVIEHRETPGLGDKLDLSKSALILSFNGKSLDNPRGIWVVRKDGGTFDSFTGATITPRAVVRQAHQTLVFFQEYREYLLTASGPPATEDEIP